MQRLVDRVERILADREQLRPARTPRRIGDVAAEAGGHDLPGIEVELESIEKHDVVPASLTGDAISSIDRLETIQAEDGGHPRLVSGRGLPA